MILKLRSLSGQKWMCWQKWMFWQICGFFLLESEKSNPCLFLLLQSAFFGSWPLPSSQAAITSLWTLLSLSYCLPDSDPLTPFYKDLCDYTGPTRISQSDLPKFFILITLEKFLLYCKVYSQVPGTGVWTSLRRYSTYYHSQCWDT